MARRVEEHRTIEKADTAEVFSLLGHEKRLSVLTALHQQNTAGTVAFSALFDHVDIADSAVFNYHLNELRPEFARKEDDGYRLTAAGRRVARAVVAGTYTATPELDPFDIQGTCYACGEPSLQATYRDEAFHVRCTACNRDILEVHTPPTVIRGRTPEGAVDAFDRWARLQVKQAQEGLCPTCGGPVTPHLTSRACYDLDIDAVASYDCDVCGREVISSVAGVVLEHPTVEQFLEARNVNFDETRYWEVEHYVDDEHMEIVSREPWRVRVVFTAEGDRCRVELNDTLEITRVEIQPSEAGNA